MNKYFDLIIGSKDTNKLKPDPSMLQECIDSLNVKCNETIFVGDSINDIIPARKLEYSHFLLNMVMEKWKSLQNQMQKFQIL